MAKRGAKYKFKDPVTRQILLDSIAVGMPVCMACKRAGVSQQSYYNWQKAAEQGQRDCVEFIEELQKAEMDAVFLRLSNIQAAGAGGQWTADMTLLERRYPEHFGRRDRTEVTGAGGGALEHRVVFEVVRPESNDDGDGPADD